VPLSVKLLKFTCLAYTVHFLPRDKARAPNLSAERASRAMTSKGLRFHIRRFGRPDALRPRRRHCGCIGADMEYWWLPPELKRYRDRIHFTGWLTPGQLVELYLTADLLAVPSWYERFGMVILEGMLYGLPIVAAAVGGLSEILEHGRTGILCRPKDAESLGDAILKLVMDARLRWQIGVAAAEVRERWLWPHVVRKMRGVYREAALDHSRYPILHQSNQNSV